jgi:hypothetical protein
VYSTARPTRIGSLLDHRDLSDTVLYRDIATLLLCTSPQLEFSVFSQCHCWGCVNAGKEMQLFSNVFSVICVHVVYACPNCVLISNSCKHAYYLELILFWEWVHQCSQIHWQKICAVSTPDCHDVEHAIPRDTHLQSRYTHVYISNRDRESWTTNKSQHPERKSVQGAPPKGLKRDSHQQVAFLALLWLVSL